MAPAEMNRCVLGDCRDGMRELIAQGVRVQTCIMSPPYYGLRDYGVHGQLGLETTWPEYIDNMVQVFRLVRELLRDDGTLWLNIGDCYATGAGAVGNCPGGGERGAKWADGVGPMTSPNRMPQPGLKAKDLMGMPWRLAFALQADGWYLRSDIIWEKPNPMPESIKDRPTKAHEYIFLLSKSERYSYDADAIKEPASDDTHARYSRAQSGYAPPGQDPQRGFAVFRPNAHKPVAGWATGNGKHSAIAHQQPDGNGERKVYPGSGVGFGHGYDKNPKPRVKNNAGFDAAMVVMPEFRNKRSVWTIPTEAFSGAHFATFPQALVEPCILAGSRVGDVVFDPFMGSGTVAQVAQRLGRRWLGCELSPEYHKLIEQRSAQLGMELV